MFKRLTPKTAVFIMVLLFGTFSKTAHAQEEIPNYTLEVVVFETYELNSWIEEYWPETLDDLDYENTLYLADISTDTMPINQFNILKQPNELNTVSEKLAPKKGYRILFHQAWSQDTSSDDKMPKLIIESAESVDDNTHLAGTVKLYKSRFAHVEFDLRFNRLIPAEIKQEFFTQQHFSDDQMLAEYWPFSLKTARKIRPNQLHYIDHPLFGILVQLRYNGPAEQ